MFACTQLVLILHTFCCSLLLCSCAGGSSITKAAEALKRHGPVVLTATPGRLLTLLSRRPVMQKPNVRPTSTGQDTRDLSVALVLEEVRLFLRVEARGYLCVGSCARIFASDTRV